jgi:hypothetical protein
MKENYRIGATSWYHSVAEDCRIPKMPAINPLHWNEDWRGSAFLIISRFQVFIHAFRAGELTTDENELFSFLDDAILEQGVSVVDIEPLFQTRLHIKFFRQVWSCCDGC